MLKSAKLLALSIMNSFRNAVRRKLAGGFRLLLPVSHNRWVSESAKLLITRIDYNGAR